MPSAPTLVLASRMGAALHALSRLNVARQAGGSRLAYIPTADLGGILHRMVGRPMAVRQLHNAGFRVHVLDVSRATRKETDIIIRSADAICVGGGNTFHLLRELRRSGAADVLVDEVGRGKPYIGISAGAVVVGPDIGYIRAMDEPALGAGLVDTRGLGLVDFCVVPHMENLMLGRAASVALSGLSGGSARFKAITNRQAIVVKGGTVFDSKRGVVERGRCRHLNNTVLR